MPLLKLPSLHFTQANGLTNIRTVAYACNKDRCFSLCCEERCAAGPERTMCVEPRDQPFDVDFPWSTFRGRSRLCLDEVLTPDTRRLAHERIRRLNSETSDAAGKTKVWKGPCAWRTRGRTGSIARWCEAPSSLVPFLSARCIPPGPVTLGLRRVLGNSRGDLTRGKEACHRCHRRLGCLACCCSVRQRTRACLLPHPGLSPI